MMLHLFPPQPLPVLPEMLFPLCSPGHGGQKVQKSHRAHGQQLRGLAQVSHLTCLHPVTLNPLQVANPPVSQADSPLIPTAA